MRGGDGADAFQRGDDGDTRRVDEGAEFGESAGHANATTGVDDRGTALAHQFDGTRYGWIVQVGRGGGVVLLVKFEIGDGVGDVFRQVNQHRAGTARARDAKCFVDDARKLGGRIHQEAVLHDRQGDAEDVHFLEGVGAHRVRLRLGR